MELKDIEILLAVITGFSLVVPFTPEPEFYYYKSKKEEEKEPHEHQHQSSLQNQPAITTNECQNNL